MFNNPVSAFELLDERLNPILASLMDARKICEFVVGYPFSEETNNALKKDVAEELSKASKQLNEVIKQFDR
ncbi:MAG: hypothetical protein OXG78_06925 [Chloroflexi bacterium]|nr:hypothetical protein [Chloroflexota bacterium]